jgi:hypothetical protein
MQHISCIDDEKKTFVPTPLIGGKHDIGHLFWNRWSIRVPELRLAIKVSK